MAPGEGDHGLIGGLVPLGGRLGLGAEIFSRQQRVKDSDSIKIKSVLIGGEMLKKRIQLFAGGKGPELLFPGGHLGADFWVSGKGVIEARSYMTPVDTGHPSGLGIFGRFCQGMGKKSFLGISGGWGSFFHRGLKSSAKNGKDGKGFSGKEEVADGLKPDHHEFDRVFSLKAPALSSDREGAVGGDFGEEVRVGVHLSERGLKAGGKAGEFAGATVAHAENNHAGGEPVPVTPKGVGLGVEIEVHPKIDMGHDRAAMILRSRLRGSHLFEGGLEVSQSFPGIGRVAGAGTTCRQLDGMGCQAFGRRASTAFQSTKFRNSSM